MDLPKGCHHEAVENKLFQADKVTENKKQQKRKGKKVRRGLVGVFIVCLVLGMKPDTSYSLDSLVDSL